MAENVGSDRSDATRAGVIRHQARTITLVVILSFVFHLLLLLLPRALRWDEPAYLLIGRSLWAGQGLTWTDSSVEVHYPPTFPALFGGTWRIVGDPELATDLWLVIAGSLLVLPIYALAARAFNPRVAVLAAILVAVFPGLTTSVLYWGTMTEPVFLLLLYVAAWCARRGVERDDWRKALVAGALLGIAYLGRPEGIGWFVSLALATGLVRWLDGCLLARRTWTGLAALGLGFTVFAMPYVVFLHHHTSRWMLSGKTAITFEIGAALLEDDQALYDEITNSLDQASGETRWHSEQRFEDASSTAKRTAGRVAVRVGRNLRRLGSRAVVQPVFPLFLVVLVMVAWLSASWRRERWRAEVWLWATVLPVGMFVTFHIQQRFFSPAFPSLLIWAAAGFETLGVAIARWAQHRPGWRYARGGLLIAVLAILAVAHLTVLRQQLVTLRGVHREVGQWIGAHTPAGAKVLTVELAVCVYADRDCLPSPRAPLPQLLDYARRHDGSYLVIDEWETREARPFLLPLLDPASSPPELEPVFITEDRHGRAIVYSLRG